MADLLGKGKKQLPAQVRPWRALELAAQLVVENVAVFALLPGAT